MSVLNTILIIIIMALLSILLGMLFGFKNLFKLYSVSLKDNVRIAQENYDNTLKLEANNDAYNKLSNRYILLDVAHSICMMLMNLNNNNEEKYTYYFNNLYFFGVPQDVLSNPEKLTEFHNNCLEGNYIVEEGEKPYKCKFIFNENNKDNLILSNSEKS